MRISDWSSDVCSSDLLAGGRVRDARPAAVRPVRKGAIAGAAAGRSGRVPGRHRAVLRARAVRARRAGLRAATGRGAAGGDLVAVRTEEPSTDSSNIIVSRMPAYAGQISYNTKQPNNTN